MDFLVEEFWISLGAKETCLLFVDRRLRLQMSCSFAVTNELPRISLLLMSSGQLFKPICTTISPEMEIHIKMLCDNALKLIDREYHKFGCH
jgi:hypothetical protein